MPPPTPIYDLMLLLSTSAPDERRAKIRADVEAAISSGGGSIERNDDWGQRAMAYQIDHQAEAEYHLLQFSGPASLLDSLSHSLKIADGVVRFRIIKLRAGTPAAPDPRSVAAAAPPTAPAPPAPAAPEPPTATEPAPDAPAPPAAAEPAPAAASSAATAVAEGVDSDA